MGCVYSKGRAEKSDFLTISDEFGGTHRDDLSFYDSGELKLTPARAGSGKTPELSSIIGRAGMASLERAVEVLDTLGSSMSTFNANSGFVSGVAARGNKVSILAFEVANTIAKGANLVKSLSEENVCFLKEDVLKSDGVRELVSADSRELMITAAADKRYELDVFSAEVIRFGNLCKDPAWHNLDRYFRTLGSELTPQEQLNEEVETGTQQLINLAQNTSELYHEMHALDRFEQDYQMKLREREVMRVGRNGFINMAEGSSIGSGGGDERDVDNAPLWKYVIKLEKLKGGGGNWKFKCKYCHEEFQGSYSRIREHLMREKGHGIRACNAVKSDHWNSMKQQIDQAAIVKVQTSSKFVPLSSSSGSCQIETKKRRGPGIIEYAFNKAVRDELDEMIARMFYSSGLPFNLARNPYYAKSYTHASTHSISGYKPPEYNMLRTTLLQNERSHIERMLTPIKETWRSKDVTIVSDGWSDVQRRPLINIMAVNESGPMFLKAINAEGQTKNRHFISDLLLDAIKEVGPYNVVQIITDNAAVCKAAGAIVEDNYPHIFWTPCVVHTLNLAIKNICAAKNTEVNEITYEECRWISEVSIEVMDIKNFIMNHSMRLSMFNDHVKLKLLSIADTRFASMIIMMRRFKTIKRGLQDMVLSEHWSIYREDDVMRAQAVKEKILNDIWWDKIEYIISFTEPIYEMLRIADTDKPTLHLIYDMWDSMIEKVKGVIYRHEGKIDDEESDFYEVVHTILVDRWNKSSTPLHCLAHSLNPSELKRQRKLVKNLRKKSLWSRNLEEVVEKLVDVVIYVHRLIVEAFGVTDTDLVKQGLDHKQRLGASGLALHYANIINKIDNIVSRPLSLPANTRDTLYKGLPIGIKAALRSRIQTFDSNEEYTVAQIKAEMQKTLSWIVPLAENTIRAHQGFGWVGEWANTSTETNKKPALHHSITRIQTLYHTDKDRTEEHILELVVWLHHLVTQVRSKGYGFNSTRSFQKNAMPLKVNKKTGTSLDLSEEDREMLERVGSNKASVLGRSKSQELASGKVRRAQLTKGLSRSFGNSPSKEFSMCQELHLERTRVLDILDGLSTCS